MLKPLPYLQKHNLYLKEVCVNRLLFYMPSFKKKEFILGRLIDNFKETSTSLLPMVGVVMLIQLKLQPVAWLTIL